MDLNKIKNVTFIGSVILITLSTVINQIALNRHYNEWANSFHIADKKNKED